MIKLCHQQMSTPNVTTPKTRALFSHSYLAKNTNIKPPKPSLKKRPYWVREYYVQERQIVP